MLETYVRPIYQTLLVTPVAKALVNKLTPNHITYMACLSGVLVFPLLCLGSSLGAVLCLCLSGYCDTLDGTLARLTQTSSNQGTILDIVCDRLVEFAVMLGLFAVDPTNRAWLTLFMLGSVLLCVTSFLVVGIFTPNTSEKSFHYSPGLMERAEAFIFFTAMIIWKNAFTELATLFTLLVGLTAVLRLFQYYQQYKVQQQVI